MPNPIVDVRDLCVNIKLDEGLLTPVRGVNFQIYPCLLYTSPSPRD